MKKINFTFIMILVLCLFMTGCSKKSEDIPEETKNEEVSTVNNQQETVDKESGLLYPVMEWWELYNQNGFDAVAALITNTNDKAIDVTYDLVYYKNGKEVARSEMFSNCSILPNHKDVIWSNFDIPNATAVDEVRMENVVVSEALHTPIDGIIELDGIGTECELYFLPMFDVQPTYLSAYFVFYNDANGNDQFDKGEISFVGDTSNYVEERWYCVEQMGHYTDFDIYFTAY